MVPWAMPSLPFNQYLDRFSRFCRANERDQQTQGPRYSDCSNKPRLAIAVMRPNNINAFNML